MVDWEEGELEKLQKKSKKTPKWFIETDYSISTMSISGKEFVIGCPCGSVDKYEDFINQHDRQIAEYLNKKAEELKEKADQIEVKQ